MVLVLQLMKKRGEMVKMFKHEREHKNTDKFCQEKCTEQYLEEEKRKVRNFIKKNPQYSVKLGKIHKKLLKIK